MFDWVQAFTYSARDSPVMMVFRPGGNRMEAEVSPIACANTAEIIRHSGSTRHPGGARWPQASGAGR